MMCLIKSILGIGLILTLAVICCAQNPQQLPEAYEPLTKLEALEARTGTVIVRNYTIIGSVSGFGGEASVSGDEFVDIQSGRKEYGIVINIIENGREERAERLYVDYEEIDPLIKSLDYIIKIEKSATLENFKTQYKTRGGLSVATFNRANGALQAAISGSISGRYSVVFSLGKLADFRKLIVDARTALDKIK